ncbi:DUF5305 domain-containing protein [Haloarchaeobius sp. DFWS5]|uniref:DUF5305 domain-containing protein n=1 Tax=Haloarchaeobius sp. DFWS5 TaxID=3446114 RepID=UPI003EB9F928
MSDGTLRLRAFLDRYLQAVVVVLVVLALAGGWMTYGAYGATDEPTTTLDQREAWSTTGWFDHSATVTEENEVYPVGTTLSNRSVYLSKIAPRLDGKYLFEYDARESGDVSGTVSLTLLLRSVDSGGDGQNQTVHWEKRRQLQQYSVESLSPGDRVQVPFSVNTTAVEERAANISRELGSPGETTVSVIATVTVDGQVNSAPVQHEQTQPLDLTVGGNTYSVTGESPQSEAFTEATTVPVEPERSLAGAVVGPTIAVGSLVALAGLVVARRQDALGLSDGEREHLSFAGERTQFDEWISTIQLPPEAFDRPVAEAESLQALVDFAIDTDNAVVEDPEEDVYYVVHGEYLYRYQPPTQDDSADDLAPTVGQTRDDVETDSQRVEDSFGWGSGQESVQPDMSLWDDQPDQSD